MTNRDSKKESVQYACEEARDTLNQQIEKIHYEEQKAVKMARVNLIVLGVLVSSFSFILTSQRLSSMQFLNSHSAVGALLLIASAIPAGMAYSSSRMELGASPVVISKASEMAPEEFYTELKWQYKNWLEANNRAYTIIAYRTKWVILLSTTGMGFIIGGFIVGITSVRGSIWSFALLALEFFGILIGVFISRLTI